LTYLGEFTRRSISRALTPSAQNAMVKIAPGIDTDHFAPQSAAAEIRESLGLTSKKVIVSVGRLVHRKGQDSLVEALPLILQQIPSAHILFVGEGPRQEFMQKRAAALGVTDQITFIGRIKYQDLPQYICSGDVFAMPSRTRLAGLEVEGLGIVYLEASACGVAVVGGASGGAPDAVIEGKTGVVVDGTSVTEIAAAVSQLLRDQDLAQQMGAAGRQWIIDEWRWERWAEQFNSLLLADQPSGQR
jgi:phosphatidylinositol alpha-1,6-mannosyltransferase